MIDVSTRSLRAERARAIAPRVLVLLALAVLCLLGLRSLVAGPPEQIVRNVPAPAAPVDAGLDSYAEAFAREYLTWTRDGEEDRERRLAPFLGDGLGGDAGVAPAGGSAETVRWTAVAGIAREPGRTLVTVMARTDARTVYLSVPVARDRRGLLRIAGYPALVGPLADDPAGSLDPAGEPAVEDAGLRAVVSRAVANYLAGARDNLLADLTPSAVVSIPDDALHVVSSDDVTWVQPDRRVAVHVHARDAEGTVWTLRYELDVQRSDRWYVRSIHVDPTSTGGS